MNRQSPPIPHLPRSRLAVTMASLAGILLLTFLSGAASWNRAHSDGANTGFADVITAPAGRNSLTVPGLGSFAPGVGPVVAPDGTVYIGNEQGRLFAFHADGSQAWSRDLPGRQAITASAAIGADGTIYVVGVAEYRYHRVDPPVTRYESTLHRFVPGGGWLGGTPFPDRGGRGATSAPPNIWSSGDVEAVMVPVIYKAFGGYDLRVVAFSTGGGILAETRVTYVGSTIHAEGLDPLCLVPPVLTLICLFTGGTGLGFSVPAATSPSTVHQLPLDIDTPLPGVAVIPGTPWVIVSDRIHDLVGYTFTPGDGFTEEFRTRDPTRTMLSPPTITADGHSAVGTAGGSGGAVVFAGPNVEGAPAIPVEFVHAAPTRLADGRIAVVQRSGGFAVLRGYAHVQRIALPGQSIASAAASRNHLFVSTASAFYTYDARTIREVSRVDWVGGGLSPPAIGPQGHVYAVASNILFVFPPPAPCRLCPEVEPPLEGDVLR